MVIIGLLICLCLSVLPCGVLAVSTADAEMLISPDENCTLTIVCTCGGTAFPDVPVQLYKIADVSAEAYYTLTPAFRDTALVVNGLQSAGEWDTIRSTLQAHILANGIAADFSAATDPAGQVRWEGLKPGLYLAVIEEAVREDLQCSFSPAVIALPGLDTDGLWQYQVTVTPKPEIIPPIKPNETTRFQVLKLWKDSGNPAGRPQSIEVEIFRNGVSVETVILSEETSWTYSWDTQKDGADWMVVERNIPKGYTVTVEERTTTFILTNILLPESPPGENPPADNPPSGDAPSSDVPKTGDTSHILLYTILLYVSGIALILLGVTGKRKRV